MKILYKISRPFLFALQFPNKIGLAAGFDKIYILDLHESHNIAEKCPDGDGMFKMLQRVSVNIFIKLKQG
ncbi:MAG: hypothetical protein DRQ51_00230 [Gammaproteobacteria bacterium]|nr:MAG: hypothetical protein DRQ51_00230 [Gammaproteobacteria bacterium]